MKKALKTIGIIAAVIILIIGMLFIRNLIESNKPILKDDYYAALSSTSPLEQKYAAKGSLAVDHIEIRSDNKAIGKIRVYYPADMENSDTKYPMILIVNGSGTPAKKYLPFLERLASWGFIVVGNDDGGTGTGETTSITLDYMLKESSIREYIDESNIGIAGYSQGGAGALAAVTMYDNGSMYKTIFTGSAAYPFLANNMGWKYDYTAVSIPYFMTAATGTSDDTGVEDINSEFGGVAPLESLIEIYDGMTDDVFKIRARATDAEHEDMLVRTDAYMTAWMLYHLQSNEEAGAVFFGNNAEILNNSNWTDIQKNQ